MDTPGIGLTVSLSMNVLQFVGSALFWWAWRRRFPPRKSHTRGGEDKSQICTDSTQQSRASDLRELRERMGREVLEDALTLYRQLQENHEEMHERLRSDNCQLRAQIVQLETWQQDATGAMQQQQLQISMLERERGELRDALTRQDADIRLLSKQVAELAAELEKRAEQGNMLEQRIQDLRRELDMYRDAPKIFSLDSSE